TNKQQNEQLTLVSDLVGEYTTTEDSFAVETGAEGTEGAINSTSNQRESQEISLGFEPVGNEKDVIDSTARSIYRVLQDLGLRLASEVDPDIADKGPSIIRYKIRLQTGERVANLQNRSRDLMRELATEKEPM